MSTVADAIADALRDAGVDCLFGMPGGGNNLDVIGACEQRGIRFVLAHTETAAAIMASAYAELTDTVGACVVTRGPGAASAVNGAAQAQQDRQPLLLICDTVDAASRARIAHQSLDQRAMFAPVTKWSTTLGAVEPAALARAAIETAMAAPRGAVHLDVDPTHRGRAQPPARPAEFGSVAEAVALIDSSRRPVVLAGVGAVGHADAVRAVVAETEIPVLTTYKAKGVVPDSGPNAAGTLTGARGDAAVLAEADLILAVGVDSIELIPNPWPYPAPVVAIAGYPDPCPYFDAQVSVVGPLGPLLARLPRLPDGWPPGFARGRRVALEQALRAGTVADGTVAPWDVVDHVRAAAPAGSLATVDAGAHMLVAMPLWTTEEPGEVLISSGLATMGYSAPAAIGAALARPGRRVWCFVGDGGLQMCLGEIETIVRLDLPVTVVVFNDRTLSLIKVKQRPHGHGGLGAVQYTRTDFAAVAAAMGMASVSIRDEAALSVALSAALSSESSGPLLLDVDVDPEAYRHVIAVMRDGKVT
jgi:acetolactate synthase-1/2/3 large subunit